MVADEIQRLMRWEAWLGASTNTVAPYVLDALQWTGTNEDELYDAGHDYADTAAIHSWQWADSHPTTYVMRYAHEAADEYGYDYTNCDPDYIITLACYHWHRQEWDAIVYDLTNL